MSSLPKLLAISDLFTPCAKMGDYVQPLESVVSGFENPDTEKMLGFIEELHGLGVSKYIDLPQVVSHLFSVHVESTNMA